MIIWDRPTIQALVDRYPRLLHNALAVGASIWICISLRTPRSCPKRLGSGLACAGSLGRLGAKYAGGIELQVTNEELASAANITPFTASRIVSEWRAKHAITKRRGSIILHSPNGFSRLVTA